MSTPNVLNAVWIAAWNNTPNIFGFNTPGCSLWDGWWAIHGRVHQFKGGHDEIWGGVEDQHRQQRGRRAHVPLVARRVAAVTASPVSTRAVSPSTR